MRSKIDALLSQAPRGERVATSVKLDKRLWEGFQAVCRARGIAPGEMLDAMLEDVLARATPAPAAPRKRGRPAATN